MLYYTLCLLLIFRVINMINKVNFEDTKRRFSEYWAMENHDRPLISVKAPKDNAKVNFPKVPEKLQNRWLDTEYVIKASRAHMENTYFGGESFPMAWPNLGPDIFGAFYGADVDFSPDTSWAVHKEVDLTNLVFEEHGYYAKILEMTKSMLEDSKGDYLVGITDIHSGLDGIVSLVGPENLCYELYDNPDEVKMASFDMFEGYKKVMTELHTLITEYQAGSTNWMGVWHEGLWYPVSCDFCCMISQEMFDEFVLPELVEEIKFLDAALFHLDGPGALKHLDALLEIEELNGIQWVYGAGQPSASYWIDILKKIQDARKMIHVAVTPMDLPVLLENLEPEGVMYELWVPSEYEADEIIKMALRSRRKKVY
jgi:hypothetical protein